MSISMTWPPLIWVMECFALARCFQAFMANHSPFISVTVQCCSDDTLLAAGFIFSNHCGFLLNLLWFVCWFLTAVCEAPQYSVTLSPLFNRKLYQHNNAHLGMAIMRAGVTHWHAGQIEMGHSMICKAYGILMVTHGPNHAITRDLEVHWYRTLLLCIGLWLQYKSILKI